MDVFTNIFRKSSQVIKNFQIFLKHIFRYFCNIYFRDSRNFTLVIFYGIFAGFSYPDPWNRWIFGISQSRFFRDFQIPILNPGITDMPGFFDLAEKSRSRYPISVFGIPKKSHPEANSAHITVIGIFGQFLGFLQKSLLFEFS